MRSIHSYLTSEYGKESVEIYWRWEKYEYKMVDFQNHICFSLRCLSKDVIPTSVRLKSNIKTPKGKYNIRKVERALLNERIRSINNSIAMFKLLRDTCKDQLESILDKGTMEKCSNFVETRRERRHLSTLDWHLSKFKRLCHNYTGGHSSPLHGVHGENGCTKDTCTVIKSTTTTVDQKSFGYDSENNSNNTSTSTYTIGDDWVRNPSKTPMTEAQECLLAHGSNFVLVPKDQPTCEYIAAKEKACQHLMQSKVEELRGEKL